MVDLKSRHSLDDVEVDIHGGKVSPVGTNCIVSLLSDANCDQETKQIVHIPVMGLGESVNNR